MEIKASDIKKIINLLNKKKSNGAIRYEEGNIKIDINLKNLYDSEGKLKPISYFISCEYSPRILFYSDFSIFKNNIPIISLAACKKEIHVRYSTQPLEEIIKIIEQSLKKENQKF